MKLYERKVEAWKLTVDEPFLTEYDVKRRMRKCQSMMRREVAIVTVKFIDNIYVRTRRLPRQTLFGKIASFGKLQKLTAQSQPVGNIRP